MALLAGSVGQPVGLAAAEVDLPRRQVELRRSPRWPAVGPDQRAEKPPPDAAKGGPSCCQPDPVVDRVPIRGVPKTHPRVGWSDDVGLKADRGDGLGLARPPPRQRSGGRCSGDHEPLANDIRDGEDEALLDRGPLVVPSPAPASWPSNQKNGPRRDFPRSTGRAAANCLFLKIPHWSARCDPAVRSHSRTRAHSLEIA